MCARRKGADTPGSQASNHKFGRGRRDPRSGYLDQLELRDLADAWTSADVARTKPEPDLVVRALEEVGGGPAVTIGDSIWDCEAAGRAGVPCVGLLTGGFADCELRDAGAREVFSGLDDLRRGLDRTPLGSLRS